MDRRAFNHAGRLGSFYDAHRDQVLEQRKLEVQGQEGKTGGLSQCRIIKGSNDPNFNILQMIEVDDESRLSSLFLLQKRHGIAAVLNHPHCIDGCTRFLYYSWVSQEQTFFKKKTRIQQITGVDTPRVNATHVITKLTYGIDLLIVLQLPSDTNAHHEINSKLKTIWDELCNDEKSTCQLAADLSIKVYSNISLFTSLTQMSDIIKQIYLLKNNRSRCPPIMYYLEPIETLYSLQARHPVSYIGISATLTENLEKYIVSCRNRMKSAEASLEEVLPRLLSGYLGSLLNDVQRQLSAVKVAFKAERLRFLKLIEDIRRGKRIAIQHIDEALLDNKAVAIRKSTDQLARLVAELRQKGQLISDLRGEQFEYVNVAEKKYGKCHDLKTLEEILMSNDSRHRALCSTDTLNQSNESRLTELRQTLIEQRNNDATMRLIYLDFSYSNFPLKDMCNIPSLDIGHLQMHVIEETPSPTDPLQSSLNIPVSIDEKINILLLGESGVGKSTFINAFANYLTFSSLEQAQTNEPVILIPVSFIMTTGNDFEEHTVKFGELDSSNNENFNTVGQSVTQHCKSYVFDLKENGRKLRIIDTPGFGDTRGLEQDDRNMEHILQYINNITHLNAICFLLKPNSSRLNIFFRICLTQLFSFLAPAARENVLFCFTNARSTFYTPGDTAPLLKAMLVDSSMNGISFRKENTFCFDSESFRYLVALQNDITFTEDDQREYESSWSISAKESNRLIDYINRKLRGYHLENGWQSIKHAHFEISHMIRPILEAMRNILRNIILVQMNHKNEFIQLQSKLLHHTATHCLSCKRTPDCVEKFWILPTIQHQIEDGCRLCECPISEHVRISYTLEYHYLHNVSSHQQEGMDNVLDSLCDASSKFAHFLESTVHHTNGEDPFLIGLIRMIDEEKYICHTQKPNDLNSSLMEKLSKVQELHESYKQKLNNARSHQQSIDLPTIYSLITTINKSPMMQEQMAAVKQSQRLMLKDYEHEVDPI